MAASLQQRREFGLRFARFLQQTYDEGKKGASKGPCIFEADVYGYLNGEGHANPLENFWQTSGEMIVLEKAKPCEESSPLEEASQRGDVSGSVEKSLALALPVSRARQLISFFTMAHNPHMRHLKTDSAAPRLPLWVRCDRSDPPKTIWMGAEPFSAGNNSTGIILHYITCKGPMPKKECSTSLENLKEKHRTRHRCTDVDLTVKAFARYEFLETTSLGSLSLEDSLAPMERNICADFSWNDVTKVLQTPPLTSDAVLNIQMAPGSTLSSTYGLYRELQLILNLSESLKSGATDWPKPLGQKSAIEVVRKLLQDVKDEADGLKTPNQDPSESPRDTGHAIGGSLGSLFSQQRERDFLELLWSQIWGNIVSYEELVECLTLVMKSLQCGELQVPVHEGSSSLLSKLIRQSYYGKVEPVALSGDAPMRMFLEIGVDKLKRDYFHYFVGKELTTWTQLDDFLSASLDLQEEVHRVQKLHHMLEIVQNCVELFRLEQERLIFLTQSCINYYKENPLDEKHVFQLPVKTAFLKTFYQSAFPQVWRVEISSGQGSKKLRTVWQLSTSPPDEHMNASLAGLLDETEACISKEETCFAALADCSAVYFT